MNRSATSRSALASESALATPGPSNLAACDYPGLYWEGLPWYLQDSDTSSSDDDYEYDMYAPANDIVDVNGKVKEEPEGDCDAMARGLAPRISQVPSWTPYCGTGDGLVDELFQHATSSSSNNSSSLSTSGSSDMEALLDRKKSLRVVLLLQGCEDERNRTAPLEDSFVLGSFIGHIEYPVGEKPYYILMTEDGIEPNAAQTGIQALMGMAEANNEKLQPTALAGGIQRQQMAVIEFQSSRIFREAS